MPGQKPMARRMQDMLEHIQMRGALRASYLDQKVLKRLIKKGKVVLKSDGRSRTTHTMAHATESAPVKEEVDTGGPYAKRRAALIEDGMPMRGKNWGKVRVDLVREARESKIREKKQMWAALSFKPRSN